MINPKTITNCDQMYHFAMVTGMEIYVGRADHLILTGTHTYLLSTT